ncbi:unnamed protein product [Linum trigynum]|uniref:RNase H type-1 domain-containing protein n=1 Tax=Linum trigynum TaxID=586398 RepID=A0AAV2FLA4_9ROSI
MSDAAGGLVLRDAAGLVVATQWVMFRSLVNPMLVELSTLRDTIRWCPHRGLEVVTIVGDVKIVIDKVNAGGVHDAAGEALFEEIHHMLLASLWLKIRFVVRQNIRVAHMVAKKALSLFSAGCNAFDFRAWLWSEPGHM